MEEALHVIRGRHLPRLTVLKAICLPPRWHSLSSTKTRAERPWRGPRRGPRPDCARAPTTIEVCPVRKRERRHPVTMRPYSRMDPPFPVQLPREKRIVIARSFRHSARSGTKSLPCCYVRSLRPRSRAPTRRQVDCRDPPCQSITHGAHALLHHPSTRVDDQSAA